MTLEERYEVVRELGKGAMGRVLLARDRHLDRPVALKLLARSYLDRPEVRARFGREARVQGRANHPHVVAIYDHDLDAPEPYLAMEFVEGEDLEAHLREHGPLSLEAALRLTREIGGALDHLHAQGVIHRDLKPANLMIRSRDGSAVVMDLGLASLHEATVLTETGSLLGTPFYLPPELLTRGEWVPASDQYQLAAIVFEALAGTKMVAGSSLQEVLAALTTGEVRELPAHRDDVPGGARTVLQRATAAEPEARFSSCSAFAEALAAGDSGGPVPAPVPSLGDSLGASGGFAPLDASSPGLGKSLPLPPAALVGLFSLLVLVAFLWGGLSGSGAPREVSWQVIGDALVVTWLDEGQEPVTLHYGERIRRGPEALESGRRRLVMRDLPTGEAHPAWLSWPGGQSARSEMRARSPAIHARVLLAPGRALRLRVVRPVRVWWEGHEETSERLEVGQRDRALPPDRGARRWMLCWSEADLVFRREITLEAVLTEELRRLETRFGDLDPHEVMVARSTRVDHSGEGFEELRSDWRPLLAWFPALLSSPLPLSQRRWAWRTWESLERTLAQERALGETPRPLAPPAGCPGERLLDEPADWTRMTRVRPVLEPLDGFGRNTSRRIEMVPAEARALAAPNYQEPATRVGFHWPRTPPGCRGDPWLLIRLDGSDRDEQILLRRADQEAALVHFWYPWEEPGDENDAADVMAVRLPEELLPPPGTPMVVETVSLLRSFAYSIDLKEVLLGWPPTPR